VSALFDSEFRQLLHRIVHSVRGLRVFEELAREFELHLFDPDRPWRRAAPTGP